MILRDLGREPGNTEGVVFPCYAPYPYTTTENPETVNDGEIELEKNPKKLN